MEAFVRFCNACHREVELGPAHGSPRAQHRLVAESITELKGGGYTFAEVQALWNRSKSDRWSIRWDDPAECLRFLLSVRDAIEPFAWPASKPRFRPDAAPDGAAGRKHR